MSDQTTEFIYNIVCVSAQEWILQIISWVTGSFGRKKTDMPDGSGDSML